MSPGSGAAPRLLCIDPALVAEFWPHVVPMLHAAMARTGLGALTEIADQTLSGRGLLWLAWSGRIEAAATTILVGTDQSKVCVLTACGGERMARWLPLLAEIEAYARAEGCIALRLFGRKGWARVLKDYQVTNIVLERRL